jgi:uncharacterized protein
MTDQRKPDAGIVARAGLRLEQFAAALPAQEQEALRSLLMRALAADPLADLASSRAEDVLAPGEVAVYERVRNESSSSTPSGRGALTMVMKATRLCNLRCTYCHSWREGPNQVMTFLVLARTVRDALRIADVHRVDFVWHGGEATLLPPSFYRKALWLQEQFRRSGQTVCNAVQTNGTRLSDEWLAFLRRYSIGVGVSLDGPAEIHDRRRVDSTGRGTSARVREGLDHLRNAGIRNAGVLMVVDEEICELGAAQLLAYLLESGIERVALLNVLAPNTRQSECDGGAYLPLPRFVEFLCELFRLWWPAHKDELRIRELDELVDQLKGGPPQTCVFAGNCFGGYLTIEPTGEVSACDKYIGDATFHFGSVLETSLADIQASVQLKAVRALNEREVHQMIDCPWFSLCHGGCPHDRYTGARRLPGFDASCCGFAPLLSEISSVVTPDEGAREPSDSTRL